MAKLLSRLTAHSGTTFEVAATVAPRIMAGIASYLTPAQRDLVASELPDQLAEAVWRADLETVPIEQRLLGPNINLGRAHELVASMCRALAEVMSTEALEALRSSVPAGLVAWFDPPASSIAKTASGSTLASGRPGSSHPISEARPDPTRPIR
jgi:hypothetical protein